MKTAMKTVYVPADASALSLGADAVAAQIQAEAGKRGIPVKLVRNGSRGMFWLEPLVEGEGGAERIGYGPVPPDGSADARPLDAIRRFEKARFAGRKLIDLGCMQINHRYHAAHFRSVSDMLDPRLNVDYAARFLAGLHARHQTWSMAVARYHAGPDNDPAQKRYVCRVIANMVAVGFGRWTTNARAFCNP